MPTLNGKAYCDTTEITAFNIILDSEFTDCESLPRLLATAQYLNGYNYSGPLPTVPISFEVVSCGEEAADVSLAAGGYHYADGIFMLPNESVIVVDFGQQ